MGFQEHIAEVLNAATGKVQMTPSEREERRLRRRVALATTNTSADTSEEDDDGDATSAVPSPVGSGSGFNNKLSLRSTSHRPSEDSRNPLRKSGSQMTKKRTRGGDTASDVDDV